MHSIPVAMTWELVRRVRWHFVLATLGAIAFPAFIFAALRYDGLVDVRDKSMLIMQIVVLQVVMFSFGSALFGAQGKMSKLYAYPARTSQLVAWRLLPMMALIAIEVVASIWVLNMLFALEWPIWGPAFYAAVALEAVMAVAWLAEKSVGWMFVGQALVGSVLALWFRSRYGHTFSDPTHIWQQVTPAEIATMLAAAVAAYWVAAFAVARNRRGEPPISIGFFDWVDRVLNQKAPADTRLTTPFEAQCWSEWRRKGWAMPTSAVFLLVWGLIIWLCSDRSTDNLFQPLFLGGHFLAGLGFVGGILFGNTGTNDASYTMGHFLATRPLSDADLGRAILRTSVKSILLTWAIWFVALLVVCSLLLACGAKHAIKVPDGYSWWYLPITLLGPWIVAGFFTSLFIPGGSAFLVPFVCALPVAFFVIAASSKFLLSHDAQIILDQALVTVTAVGLVVFGIWALVAARRRGLIQSATLWAAATIWIAATAVLVIQLPNDAKPHWLEYLAITAAMALVVSPVASVPLALSANRHR